MVSITVVQLMSGLVWIGLDRMYDVDTAAMPHIKILTVG